MKAFCLATALLVSLVPAHAGELSSSTRSLRVGEPQVSRLYRAKWLRSYKRAYARSAHLSDGVATDRPLLAAARTETVDKSLQEKARRVIARARTLARQAAEAEGAKVISTRVRVRCYRKVVIETGTAKASAPLMRVAANAPAPDMVQTSVEACAVKLTQRRRVSDAGARDGAPLAPSSGSIDPGMVAVPFNVALPPIAPAQP